MTIDTTTAREEHQSSPDAEGRHGLLTYVVGYDDLLRSDATGLPPLGRDIFEIHFGRTPKGAPRTRFTEDHLALGDPFVSKRHARIWRRGVIDMIEDCGSSAGTSVNGERLVGQRELRSGDLIELGHSLLVYRVIDEPSAALCARPEPFLLGPTRTLSPQVMAIADRLDRIAPSQLSVLLLGETGSGKELAAQHIHAKSGRPGALVNVNCGAIPEPLIEAELFGNARGAFTGASTAKEGLIRSADKGTLFLDEIGELPPPAQVRLLRVLEEGKVRPVGGSSEISVDVRWIAATNVDVFAEGSRFRPDLRQRLGQHVCRLPPLRDRREDLGILASFSLSTGMARRDGAPTRIGISRQAGAWLFSAAFPGNIRQLNHSLLNAATLAGWQSIDLSHFPNRDLDARMQPSAASNASADAPALSSSGGARPRRARPSRETLEGALERANGNQGVAARALEIDPKQLARWMDAYGLARARDRR